MQSDKLNPWEKAGLLSLGAGGVVNVLFYQLGFSLADSAHNPWLFGIRAVFSVASFVGFDLVLVTSVMAMRAGRRSAWAGLTALLVLLAAGGMSLDVAEVIRLPAWHAAPVFVLAVFSLHLAAPRTADSRETLVRQLETARDEVGRSGTELETTRDEVGRLRVALEQARYEAETALSDLETARASDGTRVAELETERAALRLKLRQAETAMGRLETERAAYETQARQLETVRDDATLLIAGKSLTLGQLSEAIGMPKSTLGRKLSTVGQGGS
jgi:hypothetical protein